MINSVHIQNFRLCRDVHVDLGKLTALVGRNGTGKSNLLQAIAKTAAAATLPEAPSIQRILEDQPARACFEFTTGTDSPGLYRYERTITKKRAGGGAVAPVITESLSRKEDDTWVSIIDRNAGMVRMEDREVAIGDVAPSLPTISTLLPASDPVVQRIAPARQFLSKIRYYPLEEPIAQGSETQIIPHDSYTAWLANYKSTGNAGDSVLMRILHMYLTDSEERRVLEHLLGPNGLGLIDSIRVTAIPSGETGPSRREEVDFYWIRFMPSRGEHAPPVLLPYGPLSLGTRRVIRIFTSMLFDKSAVMLIEQPEDGLHQGMTKKVIGLLRENADGQLILSSHSSVLLNKLQPDEVRIVYLHEGWTTVRPLTDKERQAADNFMSMEGPLYDFVAPLQEG